jgi:c-di-GMP-binding flagellar brake protein YcgR
MRKNTQIDLSQRLFIELGTALLIEAGSIKKALSSKLIGMKVGAYLIVDVSDIQPETGNLSEENPVRVRYVHQNDIFSFSSRVLTLLEHPDRLMFLQYPEKVQSCNIRSHKRVECFLPIHAQTREHQNPGVITNISARGCLCMMDHFLSWENINGQQISLMLNYGDLQTLSIKGEIRSTQIMGTQIKLGIQFDEMDQFSVSVLSTLVPALRL